MRLLGFYLMFLVALTACSENEPEAPLYTGPPQEINPDQISDSLIYLQCRDITQESDETSHFAVTVQLGSSEAQVGDLENCREIPTAEYENYQIPADALHAIGNPEHTMYIIRAGYEKIVVREGKVTEQDTFAYRAIATFTPEAMSSNAEIHPAELVGTYAGQPEGSEKSWLLFVGMSSRMLDAQLFELNANLPAPDQLMGAMRAAEVIPLDDFQLDMSTLTFESSLGSGRFLQTEEFQVQLDWLTPAGEPLTLKRMEQVPQQQ